MSAFQIIKEGVGLIEREIVHDCESVEAYIARKFGSVDPAVANLTVVMEGDEGPHVAIERAVDPVPPVAEPVINVTPVFGIKPSPYVAEAPADPVE